MIYTSYYANLKNLPANMTPISISLLIPKDINIVQLSNLAPSKEILNKYKNSKQTNLDRDVYIKEFKEQLKNIDFTTIFSNQDVALLCYEHPYDFCHRQIVADLIEQQTGQKVQEYGFEAQQRDYKNYIIKSPEKRIAVIGSRTFNNFAALEFTLNSLLKEPFIIVSGGAKGADYLAEAYANKYKLKADIYYPDWKLGNHAGFLRNQLIIDNCDEVIAFTNGSKGTANSISIAQKQGKKVTIIPFQDNDLKILFEKKFSIALCDKNPEKIYVFGDNLIGKGKGGQAVIRDCPNAFGIPTKRLPSDSEDAFFSDKEEEITITRNKLRELYKLALKGKEIVFPVDGLGTGLAQMPIKSPKAYEELLHIIKVHFLKLI